MREQREEVRGSWMVRRNITKELDGCGEKDPGNQEKSPQPGARKREGEGGSWLLSPKASAASLSLASPLWLATGSLSL